MLNHLLRTTASIINYSAWLTIIVDGLANKIFTQREAIAGEYCGCSNNCVRKEWRWFNAGVWIRECVEVGGPCPPGTPC